MSDAQQTSGADTTQTPSSEEAALSMLSPEERAAYAIDLSEGDDNDDDAGPAAAATDGQAAAAPDADAAAPAASATPKPDDAAPSPPDADGQAAAASSATEADPASAPTEAPKPETASAQPVSAPYKFDLPPDYKQRRDDLAAKFDDLEKRVDAGEVSGADYGRELRALTRQETELDGMQQRADLARAMAEQAVQATVENENADWMREIEKLVAEVEADAKLQNKPDYRNDAKLGNALAMQVQAVIAAKGIDASRPVANKADLLREAHKALYFMRTGQTIGAPTPAAADGTKTPVPAEVKAEVAKGRKPDLKGATPLISTLPGSDAPLDTSEFAGINGLEGQALEDAVAKLATKDPAAYRRYMEAS
jgi:hypothetical protein